MSTCFFRKWIMMICVFSALESAYKAIVMILLNAQDSIRLTCSRADIQGESAAAITTTKSSPVASWWTLIKVESRSPSLTESWDVLLAALARRAGIFPRLESLRREQEVISNYHDQPGAQQKLKPNYRNVLRFALKRTLYLPVKISPGSGGIVQAITNCNKSYFREDGYRLNPSNQEVFRSFGAPESVRNKISDNVSAKRKDTTRESSANAKWIYQQEPERSGELPKWMVNEPQDLNWMVDETRNLEYSGERPKWMVDKTRSWQRLKYLVRFRGKPTAERSTSNGQQEPSINSSQRKKRPHSISTLIRKRSNSSRKKKHSFGLLNRCLLPLSFGLSHLHLKLRNRGSKLKKVIPTLEESFRDKLSILWVLFTLSKLLLKLVSSSQPNILISKKRLKSLFLTKRSKLICSLGLLLWLMTNSGTPESTGTGTPRSVGSTLSDIFTDIIGSATELASPKGWIKGVLLKVTVQKHVKLSGGCCSGDKDWHKMEIRTDFDSAKVRDKAPHMCSKSLKTAVEGMRRRCMLILSLVETYWAATEKGQYEQSLSAYPYKGNVVGAQNLLTVFTVQN